MRLMKMGCLRIENGNCWWPTCHLTSIMDVMVIYTTKPFSSGFVNMRINEKNHRIWQNSDYSNELVAIQETIPSIIVINVIFVSKHEYKMPKDKEELIFLITRIIVEIVLKGKRSIYFFILFSTIRIISFHDISDMLILN